MYLFILDKLLVETDAPFMYPNTRASKLPQHIKEILTSIFNIILTDRPQIKVTYDPGIVLNALNRRMICTNKTS